MSSDGDADMNTRSARQHLYLRQQLWSASLQRPEPHNFTRFRTTNASMSVRSRRSWLVPVDLRGLGTAGQ
jgi:hypothetical protein